jgi:pyridoxal phosphate enzyme (YggS family)
VPSSIAENLAAVRRAIAAAAEAAGRDAGAVTLVAVSKTHEAARVAEAIAAGQRVFGENRVQEALAKFPALREATPDLSLHLIGPLQTNKVRDAVAGFDVIESVDRPKLAQALAREMERSGRRPACFVQVNTGEEPQKAGVLPAEADAFIADCRDRLGLPLVGLMCIPPLDEEPALHFALLRDMARRNRLQQLSMGMSGDFEIAIRLGATHVRVGTAIFGARPPQPER